MKMQHITTSAIPLVFDVATMRATQIADELHGDNMHLCDFTPPK